MEGKRLTVTSTDVSLSPSNQFNRKLVQPVKVVTRVRDLPRLETKPSDSFEDRLEVSAFFSFGIGIVVSVLGQRGLYSGQ